ncbi:MAG TPA: TadE/TadG family type IV pilus assembly protein [Phototrophicaceae bacterium]|nr:TadE/TadG family type IV pilus assembly protein [Phototrophicaceae bacterium]
MFSRNHQQNQKQRGQSFVEFSLSLVVILLILSGLLDLGRIYFIYIALTDGAGEAALYLSINPNCPEPDPAKPECADPNNARYRAIHAGGDPSQVSVVEWSKVSTEDLQIYLSEMEVKTGETLPPHGMGDPVRVRIQYSFHLLTPIIPRITGVNPITLAAEASQIILTDPVVAAAP